MDVSHEQTGTLLRSDREAIAWRRWVPADRMRASVVVLHGLGEHAGRYAVVAERLTQTGFAVTAFDYEGFGESFGHRGDVRYEPTCDDLDRLIGEERVRTGGLPVFLYGHSLGGLYAFLYAADRRGADLAGVVVSGPAFDSQLRKQRLKVAIARLLARAHPTLSLPNGLRFERVNRSSEVVADRKADPLVHGRATARFAVDVLTQMERVRSAAPSLQVPLLVLHGDADLINPISASRDVVQLVPQSTLVTYEGAYHGLEEESEARTMLSDVIAWLDEVLHNSRDRLPDQRAR